MMIRPALPSSFSAAVFFGCGARLYWRAASVAVEDEDGTVFAAALDWLARVGALVEQVETRFSFVVGNPFADGLPRGLDGLKSVDVERRVGWWRDVDDALPKSVEAEEELDFAGAKEGVHDFHGGFAARALERVGAPDAEDEVAPERAHGAGSDLGRRRDDGWLCCGLFFAGGFYFGDVPARRAAAPIRVEAVVADGLLASGWDVVDGGGEEVGGAEDFKVALRAPTAAGAVDDGLRFRVPVDFLEGKWSAQQILGEALAAFGVAGGDGFFAAVDVEAAVFPREEVGGFLGAEMFLIAEDLEKAMAEEFGDGGEAVLGHGVEAPLVVEQAVCGEDVEVRVEDEVVAEGVDGGSGGDATAGQTEPGAEGVAQGLDGGLEKEVEEVPALAEDAAEHFRESEDELAVRDFVADGGGDPLAGVADAALVAGGAEVAGLAGEGEELSVAAIGAMEAGEPGGEIAAAEECADGGDSIGAQRSHGTAMVLFVAGDEIVPDVVDDLPQRRGARAARMVDRGHSEGVREQDSRRSVPGRSVMQGCSGAVR